MTVALRQSLMTLTRALFPSGDENDIWLEVLKENEREELGIVNIDTNLL